MKTLWKIATFTFLLLTLSACMPDSLTKFKEAPAKDNESTTSSGGSSTPAPTPSSCSVGVDPKCTPPGAITYPGTKDYTYAIPSEVTAGNHEPSYANFVEGQQTYLTIAADANFATDTGMTLAANGDFTGDSEKFLPKKAFVITSTYSTSELASDEVVTDTIYVTAATTLSSIYYPHAVGQKLIVTLDDVSPFSTASGFNSASTANGVVGRVDYIDTANKELHLEITSNSGSGRFTVDGEVDNSSTFFTSKAKASAIYHGYDRTTGIQSQLTPKVDGAAIISATEVESLSYSIFPSLPAGLHFDKSRGTIGTLKAYQVLDDGSVTVVTGSRTVTGVGTAFLSQLQVNQSIEINGELHQVESITSNTEMTTYLPFAASATLLASFKKILSGSVTLTNGSAAVIGVGTDFTNEIVTTKNLVIDDVADFTGASGAGLAIGAVVTGTSLTLAGNFGGTALTIPELKATDYTITAKNILGQSTSTVIKIGLLDTVQPKTLTKVQYPLSVTEKIIIPVAISTNFSKGNYISNKYGTIALVDYVDNTNKKVFATVAAVGNICTDTTYTTSGTCTGAGELWISKNFDSADELDNAPAFFASETTATADATRVYPVSNSTPIVLKQTVSPTLGAVELASLEYSIAPNISAGQGFCSNTLYNNEFDCNANGGTWSQGLLFAIVDQCSTGNVAHTTSVLCTGAGGTWILKGEFYGLVSTSFPETSFVVTTTNVLGRSVTSNVKIAVNEAPAGLAATRNVLLHVPSYFAFEVGDAISSNNGAKGTVTGKFKTAATPPFSNAEKGTFEYYFLEVKVLEGAFSDFDDLDNIPTFTAQKTYVLGDGTYFYNTKISVASSNSFKDPEYSDYVKHQNLLQVGGLDRARVMFNDEFNDNLYLIVYDTAVSAASADPITLSTQNVLTASNITGNPTATVSTLEANNITFDTTGVTGLTGASKGFDITTVGDAGIGMLHKYDSVNDKVYVSVTEGTFTRSTNFDPQSPHAASTTGTTGEISNEAAFYFYRGEKGTIQFKLDASDNETVLTLDKSLPAGLSTFSTGGKLAGIEGTPTGPSTKEKFILTATNSFGSTSYEFFIKVYDHVSLADATGSSTYILHKTGRGNGRTPCRVTEEQMNSGGIDVKDITCYLDAGEDELLWNGVKMNISVGDGMCQFVDETPYAFWQLAAGNSNTTLGNPNIFKHSGYSSCTSNAPVSEYTSDAGGATNITGLVAGATEPKDLCQFDYPTVRDDNSLKNCDEGEFSRFNVTWSAQAFECVDTGSGNAVTSDTGVIDCLANNGSCAGGTATGAEANETECLAADPGNSVWTTSGSHNNAGANAAGTPIVGNCSSGASTATTDFNCGGKAYNCLSGARTSWAAVSDITDGTTTITHNISTSGSSTNLTADYTSGYNGGTDYNTNVYFSNYIKSCNNGTYAPDVTTIQGFSAATAASAHHLGGVITTADFSSNFSATPSYTYVCKSGTGTIKARINMVVRDFDRDFKVKLGVCSNTTYETQLDCEANAATWSTGSGIDRHDPDAPLTGAADPRNFLINTQNDPFLVPFNAISEPEVFKTGGACGAPVYDFDLGAPVRLYPDTSL